MFVKFVQIWCFFSLSRDICTLTPGLVFIFMILKVFLIQQYPILSCLPLHTWFISERGLKRSGIAQKCILYPSLVKLGGGAKPGSPQSPPVLAGPNCTPLGPIHIICPNARTRSRVRIRKYFKNVSHWIHIICPKKFCRNNSRIG